MRMWGAPGWLALHLTILCLLFCLQWRGCLLLGWCSQCVLTLPNAGQPDRGVEVEETAVRKGVSAPSLSTSVRRSRMTTWRMSLWTQVWRLCLVTRFRRMGGQRPLGGWMRVLASSQKPTAFSEKSWDLLAQNYFKIKL